MKVKIGNEGNLQLPKEYLQALGIQKEEEINVCLKRNEIVLQKSVRRCVFCSSAMTYVKIGEQFICLPCIERLSHAKKGDVLYSIDQA